MAIIGTLGVSVTANTQRFQRGMRDSTKAVATFRMSTSRLAERITALSTAFTATVSVVRSVIRVYSRAARAAVNFFAAAIEGADSLDKVALRLGVSAKALGEWRFAAGQSGIAARTFDMGIQRIIRRVAEAAAGMGEARGALKELGLDARRLNRLPFEDKMYEIARAMSRVTNSGDRVRLMMKLADSEGVGLVQLMSSGEKGIRALIEQAREMGLVLSDDARKGLVALKDATAATQQQFATLRQEIAGQLAPALVVIGSRFRELGKTIFGGIGEGTQIAVKAALVALVALNNAIKLAQGGIQALQGNIGGGRATIESVLSGEAAFSFLAEIGDVLKSLTLPEPATPDPDVFDDIAQNTRETSEKLDQLISRTPVAPSQFGELVRLLQQNRTVIGWT